MCTVNFLIKGVKDNRITVLRLRLLIPSETDKVVASRCEGFRFESSHRQPTSPLGSTLLTAAPFLRMTYIIASLTEETKELSPQKLPRTTQI